MIVSGLKGVGYATGKLLRWWQGELLACLPGRWRHRWGGHHATFWLSLEQGRLAAHTPQAGLAQTVELGKARGQECVLLLPEALCLRHQVELPAVVEAELAQVLRFELDRLTPFSPDQVYYDYRLSGQDSARNLLQVELLLAPRDGVDPLLQQVAAAGLTLRQITLLSSDQQPLGFDLLPRKRRSVKERIPRWINAALLLVALALALAWVLRPVQHSQQLLEQLQPQLSQARQDAEAVRQLKQRLAALERSGAFLDGLRQRHVLPLELLRELTQILPDEIWLQQLHLDAGAVTLQGQAPAAARVVQLLESSPLLTAVSFRSPVVRDMRTGQESFFLSARLATEAQ